jgi:hypothetical protein
MRLVLDKSFDDYITAGEETARKILTANGPLIKALRSHHDYFTRTLWADDPDINPVAGVLSINAFMMFLAGTRIAMTGHAGAIFPVLRTGLEYACYAFLITEDPALAAIWSDRHRDAKSLKASRNAFTGAVKITAQKLNDIQDDSGDWIFEAYETAIDYGGHPNPRGVFDHVSMLNEGPEEYHQVNVAGLYGEDHFYTERSLIACLDFGLAVAIVLSRCRKEFSEEVQTKLNALNEEKEQVAAEMNARNAAT